MTLIPEIIEADATGDIARIYGEIRTRFAVPAVSTIWRHVATVPGGLEWAWACLEPAVTSGDFQETAWGLAETLSAPPLAAVPVPALRVMGVDKAVARSIRDVYAGYNRNNPLNVLFGCLLKRMLILGPKGSGYTPGRSDWLPPPLAEMVSMVQPAEMPPEVLALASEIGSWGFPPEQRWVPGVYRHLAHWPGYLAHVGAVIWRYLESGELKDAGTAMVRAAEAAADELHKALPPPDDRLKAPDGDTSAELIAVLDSLIPKIPEMIVICKLLDDALPTD